MLKFFKSKKPDAHPAPLAPSIDIHEMVANASSEYQVAIVAACKVLKVLERQLTEVNTDVEKSVTGVCQGFHGMASRAQSAVNSANDAIGNQMESASEKNRFAEIQKVLQSLVNSVKLSCDFSQEMSTQLENLEQRLATVQEELKGVEEIANRAKLVALNGKIEAARLGTQGLGFSVVAEETKSLAANAANTSDVIATSIKILACDLKVASSKIRGRAQSDSNLFLKSETIVRSILSDLEATHHQMVQAIGKTSEISLQLKSDIGRSVMAMQFQDRVSQRIGHVISTISGLIGHVKPGCSDMFERQARTRSDKWLAEFAASYTMDSERIANQEPSAAGSSREPCTAELF